MRREVGWHSQEPALHALGFHCCWKVVVVVLHLAHVLLHECYLNLHFVHGYLSCAWRPVRYLPVIFLCQ
jgi:hypothetical protein